MRREGPNHRKPTTNPTRTQPADPDKRPRGLRGVPCCHLPLSPNLSSLYPTPMPTRTLPAAIVLPAQAGEPRRFPPPIAAVAQRRKLRVQGLPCLVSFCPFRAIFHPGPRPPFGSRLGGYDLFPFIDSSDAPQRGRPTTVRPVPGSYDLSPFVDLSSSAQTQAAPRRPRQDQPEKTRSTIQVNSIWPPAPPPPAHPCVALKTAGGRRCAGTGTPRRLL